MDVYFQMLVAGLVVAGYVGWTQAGSSAMSRQLGVRFGAAALSLGIFCSLSWFASEAWSGRSPGWTGMSGIIAGICAIAGTLCLMVAVAVVPLLGGLTVGYLLAMVLRFTNLRGMGRP